MKFNVTVLPTIISANGKNKKATNTLSGTLNATKKALVTPIKNIRITKTKIKPMIMVLISSPKEVLVCLLVSPVKSTRRLAGNSSVSCIFFTTSFTLSAQLIRFSPDLLIILSVTTFLPSRRA